MVVALLVGMAVRNFSGRASNRAHLMSCPPFETSERDQLAATMASIPGMSYDSSSEDDISSAPVDSNSKPSVVAAPDVSTEVWSPPDNFFVVGTSY